MRPTETEIETAKMNKNVGFYAKNAQNGVKYRKNKRLKQTEIVNVAGKCRLSGLDGAKWG